MLYNYMNWNMILQQPRLCTFIHITPLLPPLTIVGTRVDAMESQLHASHAESTRRGAIMARPNATDVNKEGSKTGVSTTQLPSQNLVLPQTMQARANPAP